MSRTAHPRKPAAERVPAFEIRRLVEAATKVCKFDEVLIAGSATNEQDDIAARLELAQATDAVRERLGLRPLREVRRPRR